MFTLEKRFHGIYGIESAKCSFSQLRKIQRVMTENYIDSVSCYILIKKKRRKIMVLKRPIRHLLVALRYLWPQRLTLNLPDRADIRAWLFWNFEVKHK